MGARKLKGGNMGGMVRLLATVGAMGMKALKKAKRKSRRKSLGLPEKTKMQQRNASDFVKRRKQLKGKKTGNTAGTLGTYGVGVAAGSGATALGMKHRQKKKKK